MQHTTVDYESARAEDFVTFAKAVTNHIDTYTVPQYGDKGADMASNFSREYCLTMAMKYLNRRNSNVRPGQEKLDLLKAAHYIQMAYDAQE